MQQIFLAQQKFSPGIFLVLRVMSFENQIGPQKSFHLPSVLVAYWFSLRYFYFIFCHLVQGLCKGWTLTTCRYSNTNLPVHKYLERKAFCKTFMASIKILTMGEISSPGLPSSERMTNDLLFRIQITRSHRKKCYFLRSSLSFLVLHSRAGDSLKLQ